MLATKVSLSGKTSSTCKREQEINELKLDAKLFRSVAQIYKIAATNQVFQK